MAGTTGITGRQVKDESLTGDDILDGSVQRKDLDVTTVGEAVVRKVIAGTNLSITSTGIDEGTGDVTVNFDGDDGYTVFALWAEENADLGNNAFEWAFGNGSNTSQSNGVVIPIDCELFAMGLNLDGGSATVRAIVNSDVNLSAYQISATAKAGSTTFTTPLAITAGSLFNFRTITSSGGDTNQGRVSAWFRIRSTPASNSLINDLLDVSALGIAINELLQWNGTSFVPYSINDALALKYDASNPNNYIDSAGAPVQPSDISNLQGQIDSNDTDIANNASGISTNAGNISANANAIAQEVIDRTNADLALQANIDLKYDASNPNGYETPAQLDARDTANRARTNHTGTQLSSTISDFTARVKTDETTTSIAINDRTITYTDEDGGGTDLILPFADHQSISKVSNAVDQVGINQTTTLETWLELNINVPTTGQYDLDWFYIWSFNDAAQDFIGNVLLDGGVVSEHVQEPKDVSGTGINLLDTAGGVSDSGTSQRHAYSGFLPNQTLTAGAHTLTIQWACSTAGDEATIYRGSLRARRIS